MSVTGMWTKIKEFFKKYWLLFIGILSSIIAFILGRNRRGDRISNITKDRIDNNQSISGECRESIQTARDENIRSTDRIESSERIVEDISGTNESISGEIGHAREQLQSTINRLDERIEQLRAGKEN